MKFYDSSGLINLLKAKRCFASKLISIYMYCKYYLLVCGDIGIQLLVITIFIKEENDFTSYDVVFNLWMGWHLQDIQ